MSKLRALWTLGLLAILVAANVTLPESINAASEYHRLRPNTGSYLGGLLYFQHDMYVTIKYDSNDIWKSGSWKDCTQFGAIKITEEWCGAYRVDRNTVDLGYNVRHEWKIGDFGFQQDCWFRQYVHVVRGDLRWGTPRWNCGHVFPFG